jgi:acetoin utilization protein AcuB
MVKPDTEIREAARLMHTNKIGVLPVVECGKVMGMLTGDDGLSSVVQILDEGVISKPARWGSEV